MSPDDAINAFLLRVAAMRAVGAVEWDGIVLGPAPSADTSEEDATQRSLALEQRETERRKSLRFLASGGPRPAPVRP